MASRCRQKRADPKELRNSTLPEEVDIKLQHRTLPAIASPLKSGWFGGGKIYTSTEMKKAAHDEQLGIS